MSDEQIISGQVGDEIALQTLNDNIAEVKSKIQLAIMESKEVTVLTSGDVNKASLYIKKFGDISKEAEKLRKQIVQPINDKVKEINNKFKFLVADLEPEEQRLGKELLSYEKRETEVANQIAAAERKKQEEEILNRTIASGREELPIIVEEVIAAPKLASKNAYGITTSRLKRWRVTDINLVPREYLTIDETKVKTLRGNYGYEDKSPVEGIEFYFEKNIRR